MFTDLLVLQSPLTTPKFVPNHRFPIRILFLPLCSPVPFLNSVLDFDLSLLSPILPHSLPPLFALSLTHCSTEIFYQNFGFHIPLLDVRTNGFSTWKTLYPFISYFRLASLFMLNNPLQHVFNRTHRIQHTLTRFCIKSCFLAFSPGVADPANTFFFIIASNDLVNLCCYKHGLSF